MSDIERLTDKLADGTATAVEVRELARAMWEQVERAVPNLVVKAKQ